MSSVIAGLCKSFDFGDSHDFLTTEDGDVGVSEQLDCGDEGPNNRLIPENDAFALVEERLGEVDAC